MSISMDIIENITGFITYFAPGYILLYCFYFTSCLSREADEQHLMIKSIALSYVLFVCTDFLAGDLLGFSDEQVRLLVLLLAVFTGWAAGKIHRSDLINRAALLLFGREFSRNIYVEIIEKAEQIKRIGKKRWKKERPWKERRKNGLKLVYVIFLHICMEDDTFYDGQISKIYYPTSDAEISFAYYLHYDKENILENMTESDYSETVIKKTDIKHWEYQIKLVEISAMGANEFLMDA